MGPLKLDLYFFSADEKGRCDVVMQMCLWVMAIGTFLALE